MSDPVERGLRDLLDDRARGDPSAVEELERSVAELPTRQTGFLATSGGLLVAAVVVVAVVALAAPRLLGTAGPPSESGSPTPSLAPSGDPAIPGGPEAFRDDPRLAQCRFGPEDSMEYVFEMEHARDYQRYLPRMGLSPELDVDAPALVVVFTQDMAQPPTTGMGPGSTNAPGERYVCVVTDGGDPVLYSGVDIAGLTLDIGGDTTPAPSPTKGPPDPTSEPTTAASLIRCHAGPQPSYGEWWRDLPPRSASPITALTVLTDRVIEAAMPFPSDGYTETARTGDEVVYALPNAAFASAVVVVRREAFGWTVADFASCQPSEWPLHTPNGANIRTWTNEAGVAIASSQLIERNDCYTGEFLMLDGQMFVRDVSGLNYETNQLMSTYLAETTLPSNAIDTGYHDGDRTLYLIPEETAAFVVTPTVVERLPRVIGDEYQRTDCG